MTLKGILYNFPIACIYIGVFVLCVMFMLAMVPAMFDNQQHEYSKQCLIDNNDTYGFSQMSCIIGMQYPRRNSDIMRQVTIKGLKINWFGDCDILLQNNELYWSTDPIVCMSPLNQNLTFYQSYDIENRLTRRLTYQRRF